MLPRGRVGPRASPAVRSESHGSKRRLTFEPGDGGDHGASDGGVEAMVADVDVKPFAISPLRQYFDFFEEKTEGRRRPTMLWDLTRQLPQELLKKVEELYGEHFPLEVRLQLASWIEEKFTPSVPFPVEDTANRQRACAIAEELLTQLDSRIAGMPDDPDKFLTKGKLSDIAKNLKQKYSKNPIQLFLAVRHCLELEMKIVQEAPASSGEGDMAEKIRQQISFLRQRVQAMSGDLDRSHQEHEAFIMQYFECREKGVTIEHKLSQLGEDHADVKKLKANRLQLEQVVRQKFGNLQNQRSALVAAYEQIYVSVYEVQKQVLDKELISWKREQQLAGNGQPMLSSLETLQEWCEGLAEIIWAMRQQVKQLDALREKVGDENKNKMLVELQSKITELLSNLVTGTFIIEKQPPQVMKTNTRFTATVRLLVGGVLNVHMALPSVSVSIISEQQANTLLTSESTTPKRKEEYTCGDILNGNGTMDYNSTSKQVTASFRNLQLKKIKRTEKKGTESVMDEKFSLLFWTEFLVGELKFQLWTLSLPVVVIVHGNQEPQALATVTWDNAFAEWGRRPFVVPDKVTWAQAGAALNTKWTAACGSPLTEDNLYYLACKAFRQNLPKVPEEYNKMILTWHLFCKETLPDRNFTFWEWFYRILILTSNHMQKLWKEGYIMGFVMKQAAEALLLQKAVPGSFLLRFSDSELGGVTIAYVKDIYQNPSVLMVSPFTAKDLTQRSMADVIFDLTDLTVLYPDVPKEAFRKFCSPAPGQSSPSTGYVKHMLVTHVEGPSGVESNPVTPMSGYDQVPHASQEAQSPLSYPMDDMDMEAISSNTSLDFMENIDISHFLGYGNTDFMPQNPPGQGNV